MCVCVCVCVLRHRARVCGFVSHIIYNVRWFRELWLASTVSLIFSESDLSEKTPSPSHTFAKYKEGQNPKIDNSGVPETAGGFLRIQ